MRTKKKRKKKSDSSIDETTRALPDPGQAARVSFLVILEAVSVPLAAQCLSRPRH